MLRFKISDALVQSSRRSGVLRGESMTRLFGLRKSGLIIMAKAVEVIAELRCVGSENSILLEYLFTLCDMGGKLITH